MYILGISCFYHDSAAALIKDGVLLSAAEEERFTREKHDFGFPHKAIEFCLNNAGISCNDIDYIVFHEKPFKKFERILKTVIKTYPRSSGVFARAMKNWFSEKLWIKTIIRQELDIDLEKILFCEHHLSHAASSYLLSGYEESAILTIDGVGEWATATLGRGYKNEIEIFKQIDFPNSIGLLYSAFTAFLGFKVNEGEYKVMGMAPYGTARFKDKILDNMVTIHADGSFDLNMKYFSYPYSTHKSYSKKFEKIFGDPKPVDEDFFTSDFEYPAYFDKKPDNYDELCRSNQYYADIAASIQSVVEDIILKQADYLYTLTNSKKLCIAGGVALNSVANGRLLRESKFDEFFIQPAPGDSGAAIGAAFYIYNTVLNKKRIFTLEHSYWGEEFSNDEILSFLRQNNIDFEYIENTGLLLDKTADMIKNEKVIGWFQGRFEWGPRALGNRSILADARSEKMKDIVNLKIKFREPFRPFAPVILEEKLQDYFEIKNPDQSPLRFMLMVLPIKPAMRASIPAVDHTGTGRVQTTRREWNPRYYGLIEKFNQKTGVPILLNTSFNLKGEPIVTTPQNAYNTYSRSGLDALVMGNYIVRKSKDQE